MGILLWCDACGRPFRSRAIASSPGNEIVIRNCRESCPGCGNLVSFEDGIYTARANGIIEKIHSLMSSREDVQALLEVLRAQRESDADHLQEALATDAPQIAPFVMEYLGASPAQWKAALDHLINALLVLLTIWFPIGASVAAAVKGIAQSAGAVLSDAHRARDVANASAEAKRKRKAKNRKKNRARRNARR